MSFAPSMSGISRSLGIREGLVVTRLLTLRGVDVRAIYCIIVQNILRIQLIQIIADRDVVK